LFILSFEGQPACIMISRRILTQDRRRGHEGPSEPVGEFSITRLLWPYPALDMEGRRENPFRVSDNMHGTVGIERHF